MAYEIMVNTFDDKSMSRDQINNYVQSISEEG